MAPLIASWRKSGTLTGTLQPLVEAAPPGRSRPPRKRDPAAARDSLKPTARVAAAIKTVAGEELLTLSR